MTAVITGASSGIGLEIAKKLSSIGYDLILVARREERLQKLKNELNTNALIVPLDISKEENCFKLFNMVKNKDIDIFINNAGFGVFGKFTETDISKETEMINLNVKSMHILAKLFTQKFVKANKGYVMNVASSAAFMPGPLMAAYYASKAYVLSLTRAVSHELKKSGSNVKICALCPGPVDTEFNKVAEVNFSVKAAEPQSIAAYALKMMFKGKTTIIPTVRMKIGIYLAKFAPVSLVMKFTYRIQKAKKK